MAGGAFGVDLDAYEGEVWAAGFVLFDEGFLADESFAVGFDGLVKVHGKGHVDSMGRDMLAEFVAVEREAGFEAEGVAGAEAAGFEIEVGLDGDGFFLEEFDRHGDGGCGEDDLDAVFSGVSGAGDDDFHDHHVFNGKAESLEFCEFFRDLGDEVHDHRALDGDHGGLCGAVLELDLEIPVFDDGLHMSGDLLAVGSVDDDEEVVVVESHDDDIVEDTTGFITHEGVAALAVLHVAYAAGTDTLEESCGVFALDREAAHVGDIEERAVGAAMGVLIADRGLVLDGHLPPGVLDHLGVVFEVVLVEGGVEECACLGHGQS